MNTIRLSAHDGHVLTGHRYDPAGPLKGCVVIAPAMAVPQSFYAAFAEFLMADGYAVWTFDYRGIGESQHDCKRGAPGDLSEWMNLDYDAVISQVANEHPDVPLFAVGHSFGGQCAPLLPSRERLAGLINIAVGSGSLRHNTPKIRRNARWMWHLLVPVLCPFFGYFPGARIGVIGDVPTGAMFQWRSWCLTPDYILTGQPGARDAYASAEFPVLGLTFADDELLLEEGSRMLHAAYQKTTPDYRVISPGDVGMPRIGHFGFFKPASKQSLWPMVTDWMTATAAELPN
ncbi:MAG: alpha/beta fold hydrolase [Betaproteobacteria bacterium]